MTKQKYLERKREHLPREIFQFLHDRMRMSSLGVRIEEVATSRLWSSGITSISAVV
jgi:hypothetical protein